MTIQYRTGEIRPMQQITYKGVVYDITEMGLASPYYRKAIARRRENMDFLDALPLKSEVDYCTEWLNLYATPRKTVNTRIGSYGLKHVVERWVQHHYDDDYVTNGAFILAVHQLGYEIIPDEPRSPNASFKLSFDKKALQIQYPRMYPAAFDN